MAQKKPNSDQSKRATERKAARVLVKAEGKLTQAQMAAGVPPGSPQQGGIQFGLQELWARLGRLTVELDLWKVQAQEAQAEVARLKGEAVVETEEEEAARTLEEEGPPTGEAGE